MHQLVSTVRGLLREDRRRSTASAPLPRRLDDRRAEVRTMEIIDGLEERRGGLLGRDRLPRLDRPLDLNIVIRTLIMQRERVLMNIGGAIVADSDPAQEYEETMHKARAPMRALDPRVDPRTVFEVED